MSTPSIVFFGSFLHYSALILTALIEADRAGIIKLLGVVTTPPSPAGRKQELKKTEVHQTAEAAKIPVFAPEKLTREALGAVATALPSHPDLILTAGYGKLLPDSWLAWPTVASLNLHFSLLPKYRGANPAEWAILMGETETGITLIEMSPEFDTGRMIAQATIPIETSDTRETVYSKLYALGAETITTMIKHYLEPGTKSHESSTDITFFTPPIEQPESPTPYAKRFQREDGFIDWRAIQTALESKVADSTLASPMLQTILRVSHQQLDAGFIETATRALAGFPSVWTKINTSKGEKRLKILKARVSDGPSPQLVLETIQVEGQSPATWNQIKNNVI